ncbi:MAG: hypothetical protein WC641_05625 [Patescibacteria group bacterium]
MKEKWLAAAARYWDDYKAKSVSVIPEAQKRATEELKSFMASDEGHAACELLAASRRYILIGEERIEGGGINGVHLDCSGLTLSGQNTLEAISPERAIAAAMRTRGLKPATNVGLKPDEILAWIRGELNKIAARAP